MLSASFSDAPAGYASNEPNSPAAMLKDQLIADLKDAMRAKDAIRLRTIRSLRAALMEREIEQRSGGEATLSADDEQAVLLKQAKQRRDALEQYVAADREDLASKEREELVVLESYLPEQLDAEGVRKVVAAVIAETGASGPADMGRVMGAAMGKLRGQADGKLVQAAAKELLSGS